ncbi:MAG: glycosyltransferase family 39 protein [Pelomonas sp.]|nr:glycosyltransferase family 39 protein [Roseateles sp.]
MSGDRLKSRAGAAGRWVWPLVAAVVLVRLIAMAVLPLMDTTEARYGEIARKMMVLGDWVTPWHDWGVPFWAKPPLPFWISAASMKLFGVSEFAARLPHLLCGVAIAWLGWRFARDWMGRREARLGTAVMAGSAVFFVSVGAVMTDTVLVLTTFWIATSFWGALHAADPAEQRRAGWLLAVAAGLGLLAKGPVSWVLPGMGLLVWAIWERRWRDIWRCIPWVRGLLLALLIAVPWYGLAELRTPGFLDYFIVGEHFHRFLTPGWKGDLYGHAHEYKPGTIWVFALLALLPWTLLAPLAAWVWRKTPTPASGTPAGALERSLTRFLWLQALLPLLFFTAARNIIWPYALPSLPLLALLLGRWFARRSATAERWVCAGLVVLMLLTGGAMVELFASKRVDDLSARDLARRFVAVARPDQALLYVGVTRPFSANFYSAGRAFELHSFDAVLERERPDDLQGQFVAIAPAQEHDLPAAGLEIVQRLGVFGRDELLQVRAARNVALLGAAAPAAAAGRGFR